MSDETPSKICTPDESLAALDIQELMELLPHRPPMLMLDGLYNIVPAESAVGFKNVTINEPFFAGHFPGHPVMPGVLQIEAMAQAAGAMVLYTLGKEAKGSVSYFLTVDEARFRHPVLPGDTLRIPIRKIKTRGQIWKFTGEVFVGDKRVSNAKFSAMIIKN